MKKVLLLAFLIQSLAFGETVVAIHGFLSNSYSMKPVRHMLYHSGFDVCMWEYPSRQKFLGEHACHLVTTLQKIACAHPGEPISFVTHSIGALVLRAALNQPGCPQEAKIGRAVLIAPPSQGSSLARSCRSVLPIAIVMGRKAGWQLMHYRPREIACNFGEFPATMRVFVIAGTKGNKIFFDKPNDGYLTVEETYLNTPFYFSAFPINHGNLLKRPEVLYCMRNFLLAAQLCEKSL